MKFFYFCHSLALDYERYSESWAAAGLSMPSNLGYSDMYRMASIKEAEANGLNYRK